MLRRAREGATELVLAPADRLTPLARDVAAEHGLRVVVGGPDGERAPRPGGATGRPVIRHVAGVDRTALEPFPVDLRAPQLDVRLLDVVTAEHGMPIAAGVMSLREGSFPWTLDYDEVEYVIEGELHIRTDDQLVVGRPGDLIAVPKGSRISFGTPSWAKFLYVTYPADWAGGG